MISSPRRSVLEPRFTRALVLTLACALGLGPQVLRRQRPSRRPHPGSETRWRDPSPKSRSTRCELDSAAGGSCAERRRATLRPAAGAARSQQRLKPPASRNRGVPCQEYSRRRDRSDRRFLVGRELGACARRQQLQLRRSGPAGLSDRRARRSRRRRHPGLAGGNVTSRRTCATPMLIADLMRGSEYPNGRKCSTWRQTDDRHPAHERSPAPHSPARRSGRARLAAA